MATTARSARPRAGPTLRGPVRCCSAAPRARAAAGAEVREGTAIRDVDVRSRRVTVTDGATTEASVIVGADGIRSIVARAAGVARAAWLARRTGLTFHVDDPGTD